MKNFTQLINKSSSSLLLVFLLLMGLSSSLNAQVTVTGNGAGSYGSLQLALAAIPAGTLTANTTVTIAGGNPQTAPVGGYSITTTGTASFSLIIDGGGNNITANTQAAGTFNDGVIKIVGGDYITIQNCIILENAGNVVTAIGGTNTMTEWGIALLNASLTDGPQFNTIQNNTISLNRNYPVSFGVYSNSRHSATVPGTAADATSAAGSNSNNKVYTNAISNVANPICIVGSSVLAAFGTGTEIGNATTLNGNTITNWGNNTALSGPVGVSGTSFGIYLNHQTAYNVQYNSITSASLATTSAFRGIFTAFATTQPTGTFTNTCSNNTVTLTNSSTGPVTGIELANMSTALATATNAVSSNSIINCSVAGTFTGIVHGNIAGVVNINSNIIRSNTQTATSGTIIGIQQTGAVVTTLNINSNQLGNATGGFLALTSGTANSGTLTGIANTGGAATCALSMQTNDFRGITYTVAGSGAHTYLSNTAATLSQNISSNTFTNLNVNTTGSVTFVGNAVSVPAAGNMNVNSNSIVTAFNKGGAGGTVTFFTSNASSVTGCTINFLNNNISNVTVTGLTGFVGINNTDGGSPTKTITGNTFNNISGGTGAINPMTINFMGATSSVSTNTISNISWGTAITALSIGASSAASTSLNLNSNIINNITSSVGGVIGIIVSAPSTTSPLNVSGNVINTLSSTASGTITGLSFGASSTIGNVFKNKIYDLSGSNAGTVVNGLLISANGTTLNVYNNLIGDLRATAATVTSPASAVFGINITSTTGSSTINAYYNSVYINASSSGANFATTGIFHAASATAATAALNLRNNLIYNSSTAAGTGLTVAFRRSSGAASNLANYVSTSNNNMFYAGTPSATNLIYSDGTSTAQTIAAYKSGVFTAGTISPRDAASFTENVSFTSVAGANANFLKFAAGSPSSCESGAVGIGVSPFPAPYNDDFGGTIRQGSTGYVSCGGVPAGTGTAPDVGAWEQCGTPLPNCNTLTNWNTTPTAIGISPSTGSICNSVSTPFAFSITNLTNASGWTYDWQSGTTSGGPYTTTGVTTASYSTSLSATSYVVCVIGCAGGTPSSASTPQSAIINNPLPTVTATPSAASICIPGGSAVGITAGGASTYAWSPATGLSATTGASVTALPGITTLYTVTGTDANGCVNTATANITVAPLPTITSATATPASVCSGANSNLSAAATVPNLAAGINTYVYSTSSTGSLEDISVGATATSIVGNVDVGTSGVLPIGFNFTFGGTSYSHFSTNADGQVELHTSIAGPAIGSNVSAPALNRALLIVMGGDNEVNNGVTYKVIGSAPNRKLVVQWGQFYANWTPNLINAGSMQLWLNEANNQVNYVYGEIYNSSSSSVTKTIGISTSNTATTAGFITVAATPTFTLAASYTANTFAAGSGTTTGSPLIANLGSSANGSRRVLTFSLPTLPVSSFAWSPSTYLSATNIFNPVASGILADITYTVTATASGCSATQNVSITAGAALVTSAVTTSGATPCEGVRILTANFTGGGGPFNYVWNRNGSPIGGAPNLPTYTATAADAGTNDFSCDITDACLATATSSITGVTIFARPTVVSTPSSGVFCFPGTGVSLVASGASTYSWSPASGLSATNLASVTASPATPTLYTVTGTDGNGCTNTTTANITRSAAVVLSSTTATPSNICVGATSVLNTVVQSSSSVSSYSFSTSTVGSLEDISVSPTNLLTGNNDDVATAVAPIGFSFSFAGNNYTHFSTNSNGQMELHTSVAGPAIGTTISTPALNRALLFMMTGDNEVNNGIRYKLIGVSPNQKLVVEYREFYAGITNLTNAGNSQIWLDQATGAVSYVYGNTYNSSSFTRNVSIGLSSSNITGTAGYVTVLASPTFTAATTFVSNTFAAGSGTTTGSPLIANLGSAADGSRRVYTFTPPAPPVYTYAWSPGGFIASGGATASATTTALAGTQAYSVLVSDGTCSATGNATVNITPLAVAPTATPPVFTALPANYSFTSGTGASFVTITTPTVLTTPTDGDDASNQITPAPAFTFPFSGTNYTGFAAGTNGYVRLAATSTTSIPSSLTSAALNAIYAFGRDANMNTSNGGNLTHGPAAGDKYVFQFTNNSGGGGGAISASAYVTMQIVLWGSASATPGRIEIIYGSSIGTPGSNGTIGIANSAGSYFNAVTGNNSALTTASAYPASGTIYTFTPPTPVACSGDVWTLAPGVTGGTGPYTYAWSVASGISGLSATNVANPTVTGVPTNTYLLTVTDACTPVGSASGSVTRTVFTGPTLSITSPGLVYCSGTPLALTATSVPALGITWSPSASLSAATTASGAPTLASPSSSTTYTATTAFDGNGCRTIGTIGPVTTAISPGLASLTASPSAVCPGGNSTLTATPTPGINYCSPLGGVVNTDNITSVSINTLSYTGPSGLLYNNNAAIGANTTTLTAGTSYPFSVTVQTTGIVSVWIDFNKNGIFEVSEWFQPMTTGASGTVSIPVPAGALNGTTRMRVRSRTSGNLNGATESCSSFGSGNSEDFTITITGGVTPIFTYNWTETLGGTLLTNSSSSVVANNITADNTYTVVLSDGTCSANQSIFIPVQPLAVTPITTVTSGASNYEFTPSSGTFTTIVGAPGAVSVPAVIADTYISPAIPLGFSFNFAGGSYTNAYVSSNGFISFNASATANNANSIAASAAGNYPLIAALWDDLDGNAGVGSAATYLTTGAVGSRIFTFEWTGWEWFWTSSQNNISFQIKLYESNGRVELVYSPIINPGPTPTASIGIASAPGNFLSLDGTGTIPNASSTLETSNLSTNPAVGQVYAFTPPLAACPGINALVSANATGGGAPYSYSWTSVPAGFTSSASSINVKPNVTTTYNVVVTDGCGGNVNGSQTVTVTANPLTASSSVATVCGNNPVTLTATGASSYTWFPNYGLSSAILPSVTSIAPPGMVPLTVTGLTADVIANGIGNVIGSTTADVDGSGNAYFNDFTFQQAASDPTQAFGAPIDNIVQSTQTNGLRYTLAPYTANNSLRLAPSGSGTLNTPSNPIATNVYALVAYGGTGGDRTLNATITFTDASTQTFTGLAVKNWLTGTGYSAAGFGYVNNIGVQQGTALTPRVFDVNMAISVPNQTKQIASIAFTYPGATGFIHVMALTAQTVLPAPSITYTVFGNASGCTFNRQVSIGYTNPPALTLTSNTISICEGFPSPANLVTSNPASYNSWVWSTPADVSGNQNTGFIFNPAISKTLTLNASQTSGLLCNATTTVNVTVNGNPGPGVATITPTTICQNSNVALTGSGFNPTNTGTLFNESFEGGVGSNFAVSGAGITATATAVASLGSGAVQLGYTDNLTLAATNNSFELQNDVNLTGNSSAQLLFSHICVLESPTTTYDRGVVQYSIDGGATWVAFPASSYAGGSTLTPAAVADGIVFSTRSNPVWITNFTSASSVPNNTFYILETINIPSAALTSNQFRIRFKITSDINTQYNGWYLDNIRIVATAPPLTYAWSGNGGFTTASSPSIPATLTSAQPTNAGIFTLTATNPAGCISQAVSAPLVVSPTPTVIDQTVTTCGGSAFTVTPTAPVGTTYTWIAPTYSGTLISGGSAQAVGQTSISQTLINTSGAIRTATYTVTPRIGLCDGVTFTVVVTVYPSLTPPTFPNFNFGGTNDVVLDWIATPNAVATGVTYSIQIDDDVNFGSPDFGTPITGIGPLVTSYPQAGLTAGQVYYYRIRSENTNCGVSPWSTTIPFLTTARVWLGTVSTDWNNPLNWGPDNFVPVATDNVIIFNQSNDPLISVGLNGVCNNLILRDNSITTVGSGKELNVKGNLSGIGAGVTVTGPGKINMNGVAAQSITGASLLNNLEINNAAGVSMPSGFVSVRGIVRPVTGTLNALGNLILVSNAAGTAMISGTSPATGNVIGNVQVNRFMPGPLGYRYVSSSITEVTGLTTADFDVSLVGTNGLLWDPLFSIPSPFPNCWYYDETQLNTYAQYGWTSATAGAAIQTGRGYALITPANHTASLVGPVNNNAVSATTPITRTGTQNGAGVNLIGNPYPSPISWNAFRALNNTSEIAAVVKRFASTGSYYGQYVDWNGTVGTPGSVGDNIALGQAFFVTKINAGSTIINYNNSIRIDNTSTTFYEAEEPQISSLLRMQLIGGAGADEFVLYFDPSATNNYDVNYDAIKFLSETAGIPNIYTNIDSLKVSINVLNALNQDMVIPMGIVAKTAGTYQVNVLEQASFAPTSMLFLEDRTLGIWSDLRTTSQYNVSLPVGEHNGRFFLHFRPAVNVEVANETCQQADGSVAVSNTSTEQQWTASLLNTDGQVVAQSSGTNITFTNLSDGTYTLRLVDANGYSVDQLVTVEAGINVSAAIAPLTSSHYYTSDVVEATVQSVVSGATYEWYLNGVLKGTGTQISMNVTEPGVYTLALKMYGSSCVFETNTSFSVTQESTVGIETANDASGFIVYPNPVRDVLNVKINDKIGFTTLSIHDAAGRLIHTEVLNGARGEQVIQVQMNDYAAGLYQITIEGNQKRSVAKFSKTK